ncbi:MAG TPA: AarF/ABC1/UbiB kinase family protein [Candidatus Corynebacterium avicola]|uniref:AarF/ABC1/UbiB kinase family protein n=1 Tax=Candidatus Corynebacterium avicola TaxID=2838527 RepID=A0A9D1RLI4_9CORY|nr:AarF/ABC1/UbiB kinase family protein [Candidatus Corynebacterium avicola]
METILIILGVLGGLVVGAVALAGVTWLLANVMRRVLGVPVGWPRSILVALLVALATGGLVALAVEQFFTTDAGRDISPGPAIILGLIALMWMLGFGAALLTVMELVIPTGAGVSPGAFAGRSGRTGVSGASALSRQRARNRRYRQVMSIFVRKGLTARKPSMTDAARAFREALEESGTTFVKLGQNLSTRDSVLPPEFIDELTSLQTGASPEPWERIGAAMADSLGDDPDNVFATIDHDPMAAASVAQVHRATLHDGTRVVVKVQRPGTREVVLNDTDIVMRICSWLERSTDWGREMGIRRLAASFTSTLAEELDYRREAANMRELAEPLRATKVLMPRVHDEYCSERLLVMDELDGTPLGDVDLSGYSSEQRRELGDALMVSVMRQILEFGVFQADPHPGNVFVIDGAVWTDSWERAFGPVHISSETVEQREVGLGMLDFGAVGHLDSTDRRQLTMVFAAIERGDSRILTDALLGLLDRPENLEVRDLQRDVSTLLARYRGGVGKGEGAALFGSLTSLVNTHRLTVPENIASALRSLAEMEGTLRLILPDYPLVETAREQGAALTREQVRPSSVKDAATDLMLDSLPMLQELPRRVGGIVHDLQDGRLSLSMRMFRNPDDRAYLTGLLQQFTVALVAGFCVLGGVMLIAFGDGGPVLVDKLTWHAAMGYVVLFCGFLMALRTVAMVLFSRK